MIKLFLIVRLEINTQAWFKVGVTCIYYEHVLYTQL